MSIQYYAEISCDGCTAVIDHCEPGQVRYWIKHISRGAITRRIAGRVKHFCGPECEAKFLKRET